jgi:hypothetical protein
VPHNPTTSAIEPAINTVFIMAPTSLLTHPQPSLIPYCCKHDATQMS